MTGSRLALLVVLGAFVASAQGQSARREPHIGYVYPAGGKRSSVFRVVVGGQFLRGAKDVQVSGAGVRAEVVRHYPPLRNINQEQREVLQRKLRELFELRWEKLVDAGLVDAGPPGRHLRGLGLQDRRSKNKGGKDEKEADPVALPEHYLLHDLEGKSFRELLHVLDGLRNLRNGQRNAQIGESVLLEVTIDRDAALGDRELRLMTREGLTNPLAFQVGTLREVCALETGEAPVAEFLPAEPPLKLPILMNGQIMPGDVDRFRFVARQGQRLVIETHARRLIPYLADAVPGWFQATLALYDSEGSELAFADDYRFSPDPVLLYEVPADGEYELEIRDSIYRGREDFVYRISLSERPFITSIFPLGCRAGQERFVSIDGWNLTTDRLFLSAKRDDMPGIRERPLGRGKRTSNPVTYAVDLLGAEPEADEESAASSAQRVKLPRIVDGRIAAPGDVDTFEFKGKAGEEIVAEVIARRVRSPLDSLLRLTDVSGRVLAWNDDCEHKEGYLHTGMGVLTHHADSYLRAELPEDGVYSVQVSDAQGQGGEEYGYRLRIGPPQPDFELRVTPSTVNVRGSFAAPLRVYASRKDGFDGEIELVLKDSPRGCVLSGGRVPAGRDHVRATLSVPRLEGPVALEVEARATIDGKVVRRRVVPAEDNMQAFLYRHLTPSQEFMVASLAGRRIGRSIELADEGPVRIPVGGVAQVRVKAPPHPRLREVELELDEPPPGLTLRNVRAVSGGLAFELAADREAAQVGTADNLIVAGFITVERGGRGGEGATRKQRAWLGVLPAIHFEIVQK